MKKIVSAILLFVMAFSLTACGGKPIVWDDIVLGNLLPTPPSDRGEIHYNSSEELWIDITKLTTKQFTDYVEACKEIGFTIDAQSSSASYEAFNEDGYKLTLGHYGSEADMIIRLAAPMQMSAITWPTSTAGNQLPVPKSLIGNFNYEYEDSFSVYIGNTPKADYDSYVNACANKGFTIDYSKGDNLYYADNSDGWHVSISYEGYNVMNIVINAPKNTEISSTESSTPPAEESKPNNTETTGLRSDFKAAMDSYEAFMDEYVNFMKSYSADSGNLNLLSQYASYMSKYAEFTENFEEWDEDEMTVAETAYYLEVQSRVNKKLLEIA